jgi:hypothetical protein
VSHNFNRSEQFEILSPTAILWATEFHELNTRYALRSSFCVSEDDALAICALAVSSIIPGVAQRRPLHIEHSTKRSGSRGPGSAMICRI